MPARTPQPRGDVLRKLAQLSCETMSPMLERMFDACETVFLELALKATNTHEEQRLLEFRRELQNKKEAVMREFTARIAAEFSRPWQRPAATGTCGASALELVTQEQVEKELLVAGGVTRVRSERQAVLSELAQRILAIAPDAFHEQDNPLDPGSIARAFLDACKGLEADMKCLGLLCSQFDAQVLQRLEDLYCNSNQLLIDARVLPNLGPTGRRRAGHEPATASPHPSTGSPRELAADQAPKRTRTPGPDEPMSAPAPGAGFGPVGTVTADPTGVFAEISGLLRRLHGSIHMPPGLSSPMPAAGAAAVAPAQASYAAAPGSARTEPIPVSGNELAAMISEVQFAPRHAEGAPPRVLDIRSALGLIDTRHGQLRLGSAQQDILNVISMLFDTICEDRDLPPEIQLLISRLQLPVLKIALLDHAFFADRNHPARQVINAIARAGHGWDAHAEDTQDALIGQITQLVDALVEDPSADAVAFSEMLSRLHDSIDGAERRAIKIERRTRENAVAQARLEAARDTVHAIMKEKLEDRELPVSILEFVAADWQRVLQLLYLRKGIDSEEWKDAVGLLDDLARSAAPPRDPIGRAALERSLPDLYVRLEKGLALTQSNDAAATARVDSIREAHRELLASLPALGQGQVIPLARARIQPPPMIPPRNPAPPAERQDPAAEPPGVLRYESLARADAIPVGTWFEYRDKGSNTPRRCKLSARVDETRMLLFCDRHGLLVWEKPRKMFAYELQTGEWREIEDRPLIERTMERIVGDLRVQAAIA